jgi:hypothetical protein
MPRSFRDPEPVGNNLGQEIENLYEFRLAALINAASSLYR